MEIKINKAEFDTVMKELNASIEQFQDAENGIMNEMITVWSSGETTAPAFKEYLHRLIGANSLLTNYYHSLLVCNSEAIAKIGADYLELDNALAYQTQDVTEVNLVYGN